ncbi:MASE1 domain-containing protein [Sphingomonas sp. GCM10030256]|uniref:MASE1 domain-containing protein n=1 Tax=Sphingomonas sp. GCM10030256 TaxID=3273427 RepID=UPI00361B7A75
MIKRQWALALTYFGAAWAAVSLTRFEGGVAFLWVATAVLIATLLRTPVRRWPEPLLVCGVVGILVTGSVGLGWALAVPFAAINLFEAALAAWLLRRLGAPGEPMESLGWFFRFVLVVGLVAPLLGASAAAVATSAAGLNGWSTLLHFFTGHSLGNLTFTPIAMLVAGRQARGRTWAVLKHRWKAMAAVLLLVAATCALVFGQRTLPMLFLPVLTVILATFRGGREGAAIALVVVALAGGAATLSGFGPVQLVPGGIGGKLQFLQFYLAATVLTVLPVSADLQNRRRVLRALRESEERFRLLAEHSTDILMHIDVEGRVRYISPSIRNLTGHSPARLLRRNGLEFIAPEHVERVRDAHRRVLEGELVSFRYLGCSGPGSGAGSKRSRARSSTSMARSRACCRCRGTLRIRRPARAGCPPQP